jgi:3-deoxy-D-manno-octulosonic-acid transferase
MKQVIRQLPEYLHIIVPHDVDPSNVDDMGAALNVNMKWSELNSTQLDRSIVVDRVGMLFDLYRYADFAYVGGGFKGKLHNILEPIANHVFTFFGHSVCNYPEASLCAENAIGKSIDSAQNLISTVKEIESGKSKLGDFEKIITSNRGGSEKVSEYILDLVNKKGSQKF